MTGRLIVSVAGLVAGLTLIQWADAQAPQRTPVRPVSLVDRLERFRRNLLNKSEPEEKSRSQRHGVAGRAAPEGATHVARSTGGGNRDTSGRSGRTADQTGQTRRGPTVAAPGQASGQTAASPHPAATTSQFGDFQPPRRARPRSAAGRTAPAGRQQPTMARRDRTSASDRSARSLRQATPARPKPAQVRSQPTPARQRADVTIEDRSSPPAQQPTLARQQPTPARRQPLMASQEPTLAERGLDVASQEPTLARQRPGVLRQKPTPAREPIAAERPPVEVAGTPTPAMRRPTEAARQPTLARPRSMAPGREDRSVEAVPHVARALRSRSPQRAMAANRSMAPAPHSRHQIASPQEDVLFTQRVPHVAARVTGPRTIIVGRPSEFRVTVGNDGATAADGVTVQIKIPTWAELTGSTATVGTCQVSSHTSNTATLTWTIGRLAPEEEQHADLKLIPKRGEVLQLSVSCSCAPPVSQAVVQVQEPRLQMVVAGPDDALYGESKMFTLTLSNPGTGPAENVVVHVLNLGGSDKIDEVHKVGVLAPGMSRKIDLKMVARQTGTVLVKAQATALGGLSSEATKEVLVRRPALRVDLTAPETQYAGTIATYRIRVANPGTAAARSVTVSVTLPRSATYVASSSGGTYSEEERKVSWQIGALEPKADRTFELQCTLMTPGKNRLEVFAQASADLTDSTTVMTDVIGIADLTLDVKDPAGPVLVGRETTYEILIHNRGTKRAEEIDVVTFFSEGIEPVRAEGAEYDVGRGQVVFHTIEGLGPGRTLVLRIMAKGTRPGNLVCRTEVLCPSVDIRLASEEMTRFYGPASTAETSPARPLQDAPGAAAAVLSQQPTLARPR
jgi:uncharacterized repeat protein (TIGR01451 family)